MKTIYVNKNIFDEEGKLKRYKPKSNYNLVVIGELDDNSNLVVKHYVKSGKYYYLIDDIPKFTNVTKFEVDNYGDLVIVDEYFDIPDEYVGLVVDGITFSGIDFDGNLIDDDKNIIGNIEVEG